MSIASGLSGGDPAVVEYAPWSSRDFVDTFGEGSEITGGDE